MARRAPARRCRSPRRPSSARRDEDAARPGARVARGAGLGRASRASPAPSGAQRANLPSPSLRALVSLAMRRRAIGTCRPPAPPLGDPAHRILRARAGDAARHAFGHRHRDSFLAQMSRCSKISSSNINRTVSLQGTHEGFSQSGATLQWMIGIVLRRIAECARHRIIPKLQHLEPGNVLPRRPPPRASMTSAMNVTVLAAYRTSTSVRCSERRRATR
jgi:hypothetical protein